MCVGILRGRIFRHGTLRRQKNVRLGSVRFFLTANCPTVESPTAKNPRDGISEIRVEIWIRVYLNSENFLDISPPPLVEEGAEFYSEVHFEVFFISKFIEAS